MDEIRTRFAPSPTGFLHIGGLRTALFSYLVAKSLGGKFILRIEDTDQKRTVEGAADSLAKILKWAGINFDEGPHLGGEYGPYVQSERQEIYDKYKKILLEKGEAYPCFCTAERLEKMRADQQAKKLPPRYDRCCRDLSQEEVEKKIAAGEKYVIRQKMPLEGEVKVFDELRGEIVFQAKELDDHVLIKTNGVPTYQFANVIDDHEMKISHVTRAEEWIPSFPKNVLLYKAFGFEVPKFIHYPVILNKEGKGKLSKRQGDVFVEQYRDKGYLPEALINFCALQGWHPKDDREEFTLAELEEVFKIEEISVSPAIFDIDKLDYFNGVYIRKTNLDTLVEMCKPYLENNFKLTNKAEKKSEEFIKNVVRVSQERLKKLSDIEDLSTYMFADEIEYPAEMLVWKKMTAEDAKVNLELVIELLEKIPSENWTDDSINEGIVSYLQAKELKVGPYLWPMRVALTGEQFSPSPFEVAEVLGKEESLKRIKEAIAKL
jgi:glutamyl-tRNA synthetase